MKQLRNNYFPKHISSSYKSKPEKQTTQSKSGKRSKQRFLQKRHTDGQPTHEQTLNITCYFPGSSDGKESACRAGDPGLIPRLENILEEGMATYSSIFA